MRPLRLLGPVALLAGIACLVAAVARGEATAYLVLIVPVVAGTGLLALAGVTFIFVGFFLTFLFWPALPETVVPPVGAVPREPSPTVPEAPRRRWGGVVFLGPFPIVFGSDPRMTRFMLVAGIVLFIALLALVLVAFLA